MQLNQVTNYPECGGTKPWNRLAINRQTLGWKQYRSAAAVRFLPLSLQPPVSVCQSRGIAKYCLLFQSSRWSVMLLNLGASDFPLDHK